MAVNYNYMSGMVGQYKGQDVFVIPVKDFSVERSKGDKKTIFAISNNKVGRYNNLTLVSGGMVIGEMSCDGEVFLAEKSSFYEPEAKPEVKSKDEVKEVEIKEEKSEPVSIIGKSVDDYLAGETLVDRFLRGMQF